MVSNQIFQMEHSITGQETNYISIDGNNIVKFTDYQILANTLLLRFNFNTFVCIDNYGNITPQFLGCFWREIPLKWLHPMTSVDEIRFENVK